MLVRWKREPAASHRDPEAVSERPRRGQVSQRGMRVDGEGVGQVCGRFAAQTPAIEVANWAVNRYPAWISFNDQRADSRGSIGPNRVVMTPVMTKPACARAVVPVLNWLPAFVTKRAL